MSRFEIHITVHDRAVDRKNGKKARGSTWHKKEHMKHRKSRKSGKRKITAHDRAVDRRNAKKARKSRW